MTRDEQNRMMIAVAVLFALWALCRVSRADEPAKPPARLSFSADKGLELGPTTWLWGGRCYLVVQPGGRTRIEGEERQPCIDALDEAVRLARAEERVNRQRRR